MRRFDDDAELGEALRAIASWGDPDRIPPHSELTPSLAGHDTSPDASPRWRWWVAAAAAVVLLASAAVWMAVAGREDSSPYVGTVPDGWQTVVVGTVELSVPGDWPVFEDACDDSATRGVLVFHQLGLCQDPRLGEFGVYVTVQDFDVDAELERVEHPPVDGTAPISAHELTDINGLRAIVTRPLSCEGCGYRGIKLLDAGVGIWLELTPGDQELAEQIIGTIRPADREPVE